MSEQLSTNDIEDVVSSVRRLVSTEQRPRNVSRDLGQDKLMLTPALRVVSEPGPTTPLILDARVEDALAPVAPLADEVPFIAVEEVLEMMPGTTPDDAQPLVEAEWEDETLWTEPETALAELALGAEEAEVVVAEAEADHTAEVIAFAAAPMAEISEVATSPIAEEPAPWAQTEDGWVEEAPIPFFPSRRGGAHEPVTEVSAEAAGAEEVEAAGLAVEELLGAAVVETAAETIVQSYGDLPLVDENGDPVTVLDEAALFDMVRQLIREELQGALGERITRNVRKLVRAEINRALAARALD